MPTTKLFADRRHKSHHVIQKHKLRFDQFHIEHSYTSSGAIGLVGDFFQDYSSANVMISYEDVVRPSTYATFLIPCVDEFNEHMILREVVHLLHCTLYMAIESKENPTFQRQWVLTGTDLNVRAAKMVFTFLRDCAPKCFDPSDARKYFVRRLRMFTRQLPLVYWPSSHPVSA